MQVVGVFERMTLKSYSEKEVHVAYGFNSNIASILKKSKRSVAFPQESYGHLVLARGRGDGRVDRANLRTVIDGRRPFHVFILQDPFKTLQYYPWSSPLAMLSQSTADLRKPFYPSRYPNHPSPSCVSIEQILRHAQIVL